MTPNGDARAGRLGDLLGRPAAFAATAGLLLALFGWTFAADPDRVAPTKDPAYYTWRTEALLSEEPATTLEIEGAFDMFAGGYRVAAPVLGGLLRRIPAISSLKVTVLLMVVIPVITALLLGGFVYRARRDPLMFHAVALGSASLMLTPPFVGYLDNVLCLMFLAGALFFVAPARTSWRARAALALLLLASGFTHPTTVAIFFMTLVAMTAARALFRLRLAETIRADAPMLAAAFAGVVATYVTWKIGIWGVSASLSEAALPPPYGSDFFVDRMASWIATMRPALNVPLFALGVAALLAGGRAWADDDLARPMIVWLSPLVGLFGFVGGLTYPYYRFFNTTLAWIALVGIGAAVAVRFFAAAARRGGAARIALLGPVAIALVVATNFSTGFASSGWNDPAKGWLSADERRDLDALRSHLAAGDRDRPVVFVIDGDPPRPFQIWGDTKLAGNTSRYGLPHGQVDRAYMYLGSLDNALDGEPSPRGEPTYDKLTRALLVDSERGIAASGLPPVYVVASIFNEAGANTGVTSPRRAGRAEVWVLADGTLTTPDGDTGEATPVEGSSGLAHLLRVAAGLALLLVPGAICVRALVPGAGAAEALGLVPVLSAALLAVAGAVVLGVWRAPLTGGPAAAVVAAAAVAAAALRLLPQEKQA